MKVLSSLKLGPLLKWLPSAPGRELNWTIKHIVEKPYQEPARMATCWCFRQVSVTKLRVLSKMKHFLTCLDGLLQRQCHRRWWMSLGCGRSVKNIWYEGNRTEFVAYNWILTPWVSKFICRNLTPQGLGCTLGRDLRSHIQQSCGKWKRWQTSWIWESSHSWLSLPV
jgi:hypothetical protein